MDKISVIMPCYNSELFLEEAITSVLSQTYKNFELIIIDDGSTDNSPDILRKYRDRVVIINQQNLGPSVARNRGVEKSSGNFIAFLDSDDYWDTTFLEKMFSAITRSSADLSYCGWQNFGNNVKNSQPFIPADYEAEDKFFHLFKQAAPWPIHAALFKKSLITNNRVFDTKLKTCEDYEFWLRISVFSHIVRVPEVLAFYRHNHNPERRSSNLHQRAIDTWNIKNNYIKNNKNLNEHYSTDKLKNLANNALSQRGYEAFWREDLESAHPIFRKLISVGYFKPKDLKYFLPTLLPVSVYIYIVGKLQKRDQ